MPMSGAPGMVEMSNVGMYGSFPRHVICQFCGADIATRTRKEVGLFTHLVALALCFSGCWCFVPVPYCSPDCQDTVHICPNCGQVVGFKALM